MDLPFGSRLLYLLYTVNNSRNFFLETDTLICYNALKNQWGDDNMGFQSFSDINDFHIDVLREIANIGSGNAAAALSRMLDQTVGISIPDIGIQGFNEAYEVLGGAEAIMVGTLLMLSGGVNGMIMFLMPVEIVCDLVNMLMYTDIKGHDEIDEMGFSVIN